MTIWTDLGLTQPTLSADAADDVVAALERLLSNANRQIVNVRDFGVTGTGSDESAGIVEAIDYAHSEGICRVGFPSPEGDRYVCNANIPLQNYPFMSWEGIGSKQRSGTNQAGSQMAPTVPIFFGAGAGFLATGNQDINSSWAFKNLRISSDVTAMRFREAFLVTLENVHLEATADTADDDNAALVLQDTTLVRARGCSFTTGGREEGKPSVVLRGLGTGALIDVATEHHFQDCYFAHGGVWVEQQSAGTNYFPRKITMHHCIGESFGSDAMLEFVAATAADPVVWSGVSMIDCSQSDASGAAPVVRVGAYNTLQNFIIQGSVSNTSLHVLANGAAAAGLVIANNTSPNFAATIINSGTIDTVLEISNGRFKIHGQEIQLGGAAPEDSGQFGWFKRAGSPETWVHAGPGSLCSDVTNGKLYVKVTGNGSTGWVVAGTQT